MRPTRSLPASALLVLVALLGLLGWGAATTHPGTDQPPYQGIAAAPLHAGQLLVRDPDAALRSLAERGRRGPVHPGALAATLVGAHVLAGRWPRGGAAGSAGIGGSRGRSRRTWSRAPPRHLQPV